MILLMFLCFYFDKQLSSTVSLVKNSFFDEIFYGVTFVSSEIIIFFFLTSLFLWKEHKRRWILPLWLTLCISAAISFLLKVIIQRPRPFQLDIISLMPLLESSSYAVWNFSFPSFQSMLGFCAIPILSKEFPKLKYFWIFFAFLVALSRVYFGLHFFSDVLAGGIIGYLIGASVVNLEEEFSFGKKAYKKIIE